MNATQPFHTTLPVNLCTTKEIKKITGKGVPAQLSKFQKVSLNI